MTKIIYQEPKLSLWERIKNLFRGEQIYSEGFIKKELEVNDDKLEKETEESPEVQEEGSEQEGEEKEEHTEGDKKTASV